MLNYVFILFIFSIYCFDTILAIVTDDTIYSKAVVKLYSNVMPR